MIYVPSSGPTNAKIVFVGEAPGADEEMYQMPFKGAAGGELTRQCHEVGFNRSEAFITNVSKFRPPGNKMELWLQQPVKSRAKPAGFVEKFGKWIPEHMEKHVVELFEEIERVNPNIVVPLGNTALWACTLGRQTSISKWRGSMLNGQIGAWSGKILPTFHPAYIQRVYQDRCFAVTDLRRVMKWKDVPGPFERPGWNFTIGPSYSESVAFLRWMISQCEKGPWKFTCDVETPRRLLGCVGFAWSKLDAFCIPLNKNKATESYFSEEEELEIIMLMKELLSHPNARIINQNFQYDGFHFAGQWFTLPIPSFDTQVAMQCCFPGLEKSLDVICSLFCEYYRYWKDDGKGDTKQSENREWLPKVPDQQFWTYNCQDVVYTYEAAEELEKVLDKRGVREQFNFQMSMYEPAMKSSLRGCRTNPARRTEFEAKCNTKLDMNLQYIQDVLELPAFNPKSGPQMKDLFYNQLAFEPVLNRKTRRPTLGNDVLDAYKKKIPDLAPLIDKINEYTTLKTFVGNYIRAKGPKDRLRTIINIAGPHTFRCSSSTDPMGDGTNLQNVPKRDDERCPRCESKRTINRDYDAVCLDCNLIWDILPDIRSLVIPDPDFVLVEADLQRADLQVVVWEADDDGLRQRLQDPSIDMHVENAKDLFRRQPSGAERSKAKVFVHLTNYGGKARTAGMACGLTTNAAEYAQRNWFMAHPGIEEWHRRTWHELSTTQQVVNKFGYKRFFFERIEEHLMTKALAWVPQSTVACVINRVWKIVDTELSKHVQVLLQVHDSLLMQIRRSFLTESILAVNEAFNRVVVPYEKPLVIPPDFKWGLNGESWGDLKHLDLGKLA